MPVLNDSVGFDGVAIVTTTVFKAAPTQGNDGPKTGPRSTVPVAAIAGGVVAGALLAVLVTAGWIWWGRSIDRAAAKQRQEADAIRTRYNTIRNAGSSISRPRIQTHHRPLYPRPFEKQVKFAMDKNTLKPTTRSPRKATVRSNAQVLTNELKDHSQQNRSRSDVNGEPMPIAEENRVEVQGLPHKPSKLTVSSTSVYSTASGEEHQIRVPTNLLLSALGNLSIGMESALNRNSYDSRNRWSWFSGRQRDSSFHSSQASDESAPNANSRVGLAF